MRKLVMHIRGEEPREFALASERVTIGRLPDNTIAIEDKAASGTHAAVITIGQNSYLQDLGSTNGTLVNGAPISKYTLRHGDVILIGGTHFGYLDLPDVAPEPPKPPKPEFEFLPIASAAPASRPVPAQAQQASSAASGDDIVDRMIHAIQSHRTATGSTQGVRQQKVQQEWLKVMDYAEKLKTRIGHNPRVKYFSISRKNNDIMIRVPDHGGLNEKLYMIAPRHPDGKAMDAAIWMRVTGERDEHYEDAENVIKELIASLSHLF